MKGLVEGLQGKVVYFFIVFLSVSILLNADAKKIHYDSRTGALLLNLLSLSEIDIIFHKSD